MDLSMIANPEIFFLLIILVITVFLSYFSEDMYMFILPAVAVFIYLSYNGYIDRWVWVVIGIAAAFWFSYAIMRGGAS